MAIRFDDRIETNVAGDVLITGNQIAVSIEGDNVNIGTDEKYILTVGTKNYEFPRNSISIRTLTDIPKALNDIYNDIFGLSSLVISSALNNLTSNSNGVTIITNKKFLGDTIITSTSDLNTLLNNMSTEDYEGNPINFPIITLLSAPIQLSTRYENGGIFYSTNDNFFPYGSKLEIVPKNTLICITTNSTLNSHEVYDSNTKYDMALLSDCIQILSMPVSADSIHNDFETRIANIESLLALK